MRSAIVVHPQFDCSWPFAADWLHGLWKKEGDVRFARLPWDDKRPAGAVVEEPGKVQRFVCLNVPFTEACLKKFTALEEAHVRVKADEPLAAALKERGIEVRRHTSEGFWGESVSEFGLALTLCGLRRIPQTHHNILTAHDDWHYGTPVEKMRPGMRGGQYGDDSRFTAGTICGKRSAWSARETSPAATPRPASFSAPTWPRGTPSRPNRPSTAPACAANSFSTGCPSTPRSSRPWFR